MRKLTKTLWLAVLLAGWPSLANGAFAAANCFCSPACQDNTNDKSTPVKG